MEPAATCSTYPGVLTGLYLLLLWHLLLGGVSTIAVAFATIRLLQVIFL